MKTSRGNTNRGPDFQVVGCPALGPAGVDDMWLLVGWLGWGHYERAYYLFPSTRMDEPDPLRGLLARLRRVIKEGYDDLCPEDLLAACRDYVEYRRSW